jgi:hypothetical protein
VVQVTGLEAGKPVPHLHRGKPVGRITKDGTGFETVRAPVHFVRRYGGYGIQRRLLRDLIAFGVKRIRVIEVHSGVTGVFVVSPEWWLNAGMAACLKHEDGIQVFVSRNQLVRASSDADHFAKAWGPGQTTVPST